MNRAVQWIILTLFALGLPCLGWGEEEKKEEYKFELSEIDKKPYQWGGYGEFRPVLFGLDSGSTFYKLQFYNRNEGRTTPDYNFRLQLEGSYEEGIARAFARLNYDLKNSFQEWSDETTLYEGFLSLKPSNSWTLDVGKKTFKWGKGYAWNPVSFIDRPKDPDEPDLALEGFWALSGDWIRSFSGSLKTVSFSPVFLPVLEGVNDDFGTTGQANLAARLYLLLYDTDMDFIVFTGGSRTTRYGADFSRNITPNFEIHGELAYVKDFQKRTIDIRGNMVSSTQEAVSYLLGIRYLSLQDTTYIFEYYRNGTGYTKSEFEDFPRFVDRAYDQYLATGSDALLGKAQNLSQGSYGRPNPMRDYLYLRISQKEPFDILYFTPAVTTILNLNDQSFSIAPEMAYTGITNLELRLKTTFLFGDEYSEFGGKRNDYRLELRARYFF